MADIESLKQRLANANAAAAAAKPAYDAAKAKSDAAYAAYTNIIQRENPRPKLSEINSLKAQINQNPNDLTLQSRLAEVQTSMQQSQKLIQAARAESETADAERNATGDAYFEADLQAGELEEAISIQEQADINAQVADGEANAAQAADPTSTIKTPEATNESATDAESAEKMADPNNTPDDPGLDAFGGEGDPVDGTDPGLDAFGGEGDPVDAPPGGNTRGSKLPPGAQPAKPEPASAKWAGAADLRVILRVPSAYLTGKTVGPSKILSENGGILFPYTPQISFETQASYGNVNPLHSNYTQYFYKNSSVSAIQINGRFTVQDEKDGAVWLATQHLLRALVKMRFGSDKNAGSPPPVCRLEGYGDYQLRNVPVVVTSFKFDFPDTVDYIQIKGSFENSLVPVSSVLSLSLIPMYSRREIQNYSVDKFLSGEFTGKGYL